jgi:hypothetical protein
MVLITVAGPTVKAPLLMLMLMLQFDVDLPYMGRLRGESLKTFRRIKSWDARLSLIKAALQVREGRGQQLEVHLARFASLWVLLVLCYIYKDPWDASLD